MTNVAHRMAIQTSDFNIKLLFWLDNNWLQSESQGGRVNVTHRGTHLGS